MKNIHWIVLGTSLLTASAQAVVKMEIEPIIGYERVQKFLPSQHQKDRVVYGGRVIVGMPFIAVEGEYTRASDTEVFTATNTTIAEVEDKARLGARFSYRFTLLSIFARGGAQARLTKRVMTVGAAVTSQTDPIKYNPYAGAGVKLHFRQNIALTADVTVVFNAFPNFAQNDYMTTAGLVVSFP